MQEIVDDAVNAGAELKTGGKGDPPFFPPTVLANVTRDMRAWNEEIFGPVAPVMTFSDEDEAVAIANDTEYGLSGAVFTSSHERGREVADRLDTGLVHIMDSTVYDDPIAPFGGRGRLRQRRPLRRPLQRRGVHRGALDHRAARTRELPVLGSWPRESPYIRRAVQFNLDARGAGPRAEPSR